MKRHLGLVLVFALSFGFAGCSGNKEIKTHEDAGKQLMDLMNEVAGILEGAKDKAGATAAEAKLKALKPKFEEIGKKMEALGKPSADEEKRLGDKFKPEIEKLQKRIQTASATAVTNGLNPGTVMELMMSMAPSKP